MRGLPGCTDAIAFHAGFGANPQLDFGIPGQGVAHAFPLHLARAAGSGPGDERVDAAAVEELDPQAHPAVSAAEVLAEVLADGGPLDAQQKSPT